MNKHRKAIILSFIIALTVTVICISTSYSFFKIDKKGQIHNKITTGIKEEVCEYPDGYVWNFDYTGSEQSFTVPCDGTYKLETWGAQGGNVYLEPSTTTEYAGGYGAYSSGSIQFDITSTLYINVGGEGSFKHVANGENHYHLNGGYNGGGDAFVSYGRDYYSVGSGGGATHIATRFGILSSLENYKNNILIVSAGGGGGLSYYNPSNTIYKTLDYLGSGGGYIGVSPLHTNYGSGYSSKIMPTGGSQSSGGIGYSQSSTTESTYAGSFGKAATGFPDINNCISGGGGGFYGGGGGVWIGGAGGSGYIGNPLLTNKVMYCYNCTESSEESTKTISTTCHSSTSEENCAKEGNGYARITLVSSNTNVLPPEITESGTFQTKKTITVTKSGEAKSGVKYYEYFVTQENITPTNETTPTGTTTNEIEINTAGVNYVFYRTVSNVGTKSNWSTKSTINIYTCQYNPGQVWNYNYIGNEQSFIVPCDGSYKLETWGAQGGTIDTTYYGGYGAYSKGNYILTRESNVFINVGGAGVLSLTKVNTQTNGGYNGGGASFTTVSGDGRKTASGGGATHIAKKSGVLSTLSNNIDEILIVSAGGGGNWYCDGTYKNTLIAHAGGFKSNNNQGIGKGIYYTAHGVGQEPIVSSQTTEIPGTFGQGASANKTDEPRGSGGGGGGFYGGTINVFTSTGGSSYIGNASLTDKAMYCYNCTESSEESTKTISTTCHSSTPTENCAKEGNGYARITLVSIN